MNPNLALGLNVIAFAMPPEPPFTVTAADGWQRTVASPTDLSIDPYDVTRVKAGGGTFTETHYLTKRVRQAYPNEGSFTSDQVAGTRYTYSTDTITGTTNNSTVTSPKPNGRWLMPRRRMVGDALAVSVEAFHKDARLGQQVEFVEVEIYDQATDTLQDTITISSPSVSTICDDAHDVHAFEETAYDISALADGLYYLVGKVYAWTGSAATVRSSEDGDAKRDFERVYFTKNTTKFNAPPVAYVDTAGDDGTGVWSTTDATAAASPYATIKGAMEAITGAADTDGIADGCIIYLKNGTHTLAGPASTVAVPQESAALTIKRAAGSTNRASVVISALAASFDPHLGINDARNASTLASGLTEGVLIFEDVTIDRAGNGNLQRSATGTATVPMLYQLVNVDFDNNAEAIRWLNATDVRGGIFGMNFTTTGVNAGLLGGGASVEYILQRGIVCSDMLGNAWDAFSTVGCSYTNPGTGTVGDNTEGMLISYTSFIDSSNSLLQENWASATVVDRIHLLNVLGEYTSTSTTNPIMSLGGTSGSTSGMTVHHVTFVGAQNAGRFNVGYDNQNNTASNEQTHENLSIVGLVCSQLNIKGDIFRSDANGADGNFAAVHGVEWEGVYSMYAANAVASEHPSYAGLNSSLNTASSSIVQDSEASLFVDYQGSTSPSGVLTAGAGGGDYTPAASSPLDGMVTTRLVCGIDLAGATRTGNQAAGAYV